MLGGDNGSDGGERMAGLIVVVGEWLDGGCCY